MGAGTLPCNLRPYPEQDGRAIVPDLVGPVAALDKGDEVAGLSCGCLGSVGGRCQ